jgi:hypothetical protein
MTTEYKLVEGLPSTVEREVNNLLEEGWEVLGAPFSRESNSVVLVVQPMLFQENVIDEHDVLGNLIKQHKTKRNTI